MFVGQSLRHRFTLPGALGDPFNPCKKTLTKALSAATSLRAITSKAERSGNASSAMLCRSQRWLQSSTIRPNFEGLDFECQPCKAALLSGEI